MNKPIDTKAVRDSVLNDAMFARQNLDGSGATTVTWRTLEFWASALAQEIAQREALETNLRTAVENACHLIDDQCSEIPEDAWPHFDVGSDHLRQGLASLPPEECHG